MKSCKAKTIDLLNEIKTICDQEKIRYYLSGDLALIESERREIRDEFNNGAVAVHAADIDKLMSFLSKKDGRKVESLLNNSKFPGFYVRYMDASTSLLNFAETAFTYDTNSIGVNIEIVCGRKRSGAKGKIASKLKYMWVAQNAPYYMTKRKGKKTFKTVMAKLFFGAASHTSVMSRLFRVWVNAGKAKTKLCDIATNRGEIIKYRADIFKRTVNTTWLDDEFCMVSDIDKYTDNYFESNKMLKPVKHDIADLDLPWEQFSQAISRSNVPLTKYQNDHQEYLKWKQTEYLPVKRKRDKFFSYMFCAEDRMYFYKELNGEKKEQIMELYRAGELDQLREILAEYIEKINYYAKHFIGFCSDAEIFRVAMSVMLYDEYLANRRLSEFKKRSKRLFNIINNTNYRHFDSVENVFWGKREKESVLKKLKKSIRESVVQEAKEYYEKYRTGERD